MQVTVELPEDIAGSLRSTWDGDIGRAILEAVAVEGYRKGALSHAQVGTLLGYETPMEVDALLAKAHLYDEYTESELDLGLATARRFEADRG